MYLLDSNVFIQAKNTHYALDICPGFWTWIEQQHQLGKVFTIEKVRTELFKKKDELATWVQAQPKSFFLAPDVVAGDHMRSLANWSKSHHFTPAAINEFLGAADLYLVSQAKSLGYTVVTYETRDDACKVRVKIPNACLFLQSPCINTYEMLRTENVRLII